MKVAGEAVLHAPVEEVWTALNDASVLVPDHPGLRAAGGDRRRRLPHDGHRRRRVDQGLVRRRGPDHRPAAAGVVHAPGERLGAPGTVSADVLVTLDDAGDGSTRLRYDADAVVGGMIGGVGQRVLSGVAKKTAGEFFRNVDAVLAGSQMTTVGTPAGADAGQQASVGPGSPRTASAGHAGGQTFSRPAAPAGSSEDFVKGAVFGAVVALLGALVGGLVARRRG
jgi:carbon monoxide dehydrogenase subunit G